MKDSYIAYILEKYVAEGNFDSVFGGDWIDDAQLAALIPLVCDYAFAEYGIDAKGKYADKVAAIFDGLKASNGIVRHGDDYADYWYKLRPAYKKKYLDELRGKNAATKVIASLGEEPLRRALNKIMAEDGLQPMEEKQAKDPDIEALDSNLVVDDEVTAELLPASDRLVPLNHNSASYKEIAAGLSDLHDELRGANGLECPPEERDRLVVSLDAAKRLWESAQLKVIQIKVGIIIAVQDAINVLASIGKGAGKSVLIDLIKAFVKKAVGIDI